MREQQKTLKGCFSKKHFDTLTTNVMFFGQRFAILAMFFNDNPSLKSNHNIKHCNIIIYTKNVPNIKFRINWAETVRLNKSKTRSWSNFPTGQALYICLSLNLAWFKRTMVQFKIKQTVYSNSSKVQKFRRKKKKIVRCIMNK